MKTFAIQNLGCKVNNYESNVIARMFEADNYIQVDFKDIADVYIINTCTVTNTGDAKSRKMIRQAIKRNKDAIVVAFGCYAQVSPEEIAKIDGVDIILGTNQRHLLVEKVNNHHKNKQEIVIDNIMDVKEFEEFNQTSYTHNTRAYLKIQEGCNNFCTYCIIPYARGLMRSRHKDNIINEAKALVKQGYQELVLTGIHTGGYGLDLSNYSFDDLISDILNEVKGLKRLRISSIEINQVSNTLLTIMQKDKRLVRHLHIPLQASTDEILKLMHRKYTTSEYLNRINEIKKMIPKIAITTDIIVGFPNESDELFEKGLTFIKECNFMDIHVFPYSKRKNTPAASMPNQIAENIKKERVNKVMRLAFQSNLSFIKEFVNQELEILIEEYHEDEQLYSGHSDNYIKVYVKDAQINKLYLVKITNVVPIVKGDIINEIK
ncbi:MAG: tRNA (N(6)-L-threonylcarbamoyladenosine(37)-C(2))-methylthiotransferase MtaB [Bacilli bacterium]|jgi:threonylcarbamoyladenosine tRNA methylthiotransferase MtaB|nr:tRNA (N(6)-L-threonylcarbamoyladenosine(37)-C(2))-methylthiotransferase MtaB [Bacilli bacterium]